MVLDLCTAFALGINIKGLVQVSVQRGVNPNSMGDELDFDNHISVVSLKCDTSLRLIYIQIRVRVRLYKYVWNQRPIF